jgi:hypothetical protein
MTCEICHTPIEGESYVCDFLPDPPVYKHLQCFIDERVRRRKHKLLESKEKEHQYDSSLSTAHK